MARYIDADSLKVDYIVGSTTTNTEVYRYVSLAQILNAPTADVVERKRGKWIEYVNSHCECLFCHKAWSFFENMTEWFNFCPNCGAEMGEVTE